MSAMQEMEWEECLLEPRRDKAVEREIRKAGGFVLPTISFFQPCPWLARSSGTSYRTRQLVHTDLALADLIFLVVSQDNSCRFCYGSQRSLLRIQGFDEERIQRLEDMSFTAEDDPRERLALDFARQVSRANPPPAAAEKDALREAGYSEESVKEIAYVAAFTVMGNRITTLPAMPLERPLEERWFVKLFRPLVAMYLRSHFQQGQPPLALPAGPAGIPAARAEVGTVLLSDERARRAADRAHLPSAPRQRLELADPHRAGEGPGVCRRGAWAG